MSDLATVTKTVPWRYRGSTEARARAAEAMGKSRRAHTGVKGPMYPRFVTLGAAFEVPLDSDALRLLLDLHKRARVRWLASLGGDAA